jgi:CheY-like chemotaxis protein
MQAVENQGMSLPVRVALLGFTPFEREHLKPALHAPRRRQPLYELRVNDLQSCNLALVDADHEQAVAQVRCQNRLASTVMVGNTLHRGAGAHLPRPIHAPSLLQALDALVALAVPMSAEVGRVQDMLAEFLTRGASSPATAAGTTTSQSAWPIIAGPDANQRPKRGVALLVDPGTASLPFLTATLTPLGLDLHRVAHGSEALQRLQQDVVEFVFLATGNGGSPGNSDGEPAPDDMDGFHTCRLLQRMPPAQPVAPPPTLVLLLSADNAVNQLRAQRAGADAWLHPPWVAEPLLKIIDERNRWLRQSGKRG